MLHLQSFYFDIVDFYINLRYNRKAKKKAVSIRKRLLAGAIRIELISLVLETKAQPLYQTPNNVAII